MALSPAQKTTLKAAIDGNPTWAAFPMSGDGYYDLARLLSNEIANPAFIVWRSNVTRTQASANMDWTRVDNLSVGKARIWEWMFNAGTINVGDSTIRAGIDAAWVGTAADLAVRATVYANSKRSASQIEKILATGTGSDAAPATMGFEGTISDVDVSAARNS